MKKVIVLLLALQLLMGPLVTSAQGIMTDDTEDEQNIFANMNIKDEPMPQVGKDLNYLDPTSYPIINKGGAIGALIDSHSMNHYLHFLDIIPSTYGPDYMTIQLFYQTTATIEKDAIITIEYFIENANTLEYLGNSEFNTSSFQAATLNSSLPIVYFETQPYIYMKVGVSQTEYDSYYADSATFKVTNPYYSAGDDQAAPDNRYAVISNESTSGEYAQSTGTFNVKDIPYTFDSQLKQGAYRMDANIPFDPASEDVNLFQKNSKSIFQSYSVGESKSFWVVNLQTNGHSTINARLAYSGSKANVWVHNNQISDAEAVTLGKEFDNNIYEPITSHFAKESDVNQDGKINILTFDIQDGFTGSGGYVAGYFSSRDLYNTSYSNESEIFYIDTYPTMGFNSSKDVSQAYGTLAHEFQHMVNFNQNVLVEGNDYMPTWLNEGLSEAADQIYSGSGLSDRLNYYNTSASIQNGHSLLYWGGDTLSNYSLSYLFMQYIKIQAGQGNRIFKEIMEDSANDYYAIENIAKKYISPDMTFGKLMTNFRIALLLKEPTGLYGFKGDTFFDALKEKIYNGNYAALRGGGSIVTTFNSEEGFNVPADKGTDITYTLLEKDQGDTTPPGKPAVNSVDDTDTLIAGTAEANAIVYAKVGGTEIGRATAGSSGNFTIAISRQKAGTVIDVFAEDSSQNVSEPTRVTVVDATAPAAPQVNRVTDQSTTVTGTAEKGAKVTVKAGTNTWTGNVDSQGKVFSCHIKTKSRNSG
ncbi:Ig-like domain-containing protein [Bacillus timonensis]|uniref:Ig-like domain-containing protein n=1 Tax=Bacillus timonensis TaxID=1033734 RepID=UPI0002897118|nr:Ig-like domain-containing protein [Bacillus timonensis]